MNDNASDSYGKGQPFTVRGIVTNIVMHERSAVNAKTGLTEAGSTRVWREIEVQQQDGNTFSTAGDVVHGANVGDEIALAIDRRDREPLVMVNMTRGTQFVDRTADPNVKGGKGVWATAVVIAGFGAIPGFIPFLMLFIAIFPSWTQENTGLVFNLFPFVLIPASIYAAVRLDRWAVARSKRVYGESIEALRASGVTVQEEPPPLPRAETKKPT